MVVSVGLIRSVYACQLDSMLGVVHHICSFFCKHCVTNGDSFCVSSSVSCIAVLSPDIKKMQDQADSELNLMQFYCITLPAIVSLSCKDVTVHRQSQLLLHDHSRWLLDQYVPLIC